MVPGCLGAVGWPGKALWEPIRTWEERETTCGDGREDPEWAMGWGWCEGHTQWGALTAQGRGGHQRGEQNRGSGDWTQGGDAALHLVSSLQANPATSGYDSLEDRRFWFLQIRRGLMAGNLCLYARGTWKAVPYLVSRLEGIVWTWKEEAWRELVREALESKSCSPVDIWTTLTGVTGIETSLLVL